MVGLRFHEEDSVEEDAVEEDAAEEDVVKPLLLVFINTVDTYGENFRIRLCDFARRRAGRYNFCGILSVVSVPRSRTVGSWPRNTRTLFEESNCC